MVPLLDPGFSVRSRHIRDTTAASLPHCRTSHIQFADKQTEAVASGYPGVEQAMAAVSPPQCTTLHLNRGGGQEAFRAGASKLWPAVRQDNNLGHSAAVAKPYHSMPQLPFFMANLSRASC